MVESLEEVLARAEVSRTEMTDLLAQFAAEREALKAVTSEAHEAIRDLRAAVREAKEEMCQSGKAEARKHLAKQMSPSLRCMALGGFGCKVSFSDVPDRHAGAAPGGRRQSVAVGIAHQSATPGILGGPASEEQACHVPTWLRRSKAGFLRPD